MLGFHVVPSQPTAGYGLADPAAVAGIAWISVVTGVEDFIVEPFEVEVA